MPVARLLDPYQDPALVVDLALPLEEVAAAEVERLQAACAVVYVTSQMPRRLGSVTREDLALDKRRARRVLHAERQALVSWGGKEREPTEAERIAGAQMVWDLWHEEANLVITSRLRYIATWAKATGNLRFGKSAVVRLSQELDWLSYALRD